MKNLRFIRSPSADQKARIGVRESVCYITVCELFTRAQQSCVVFIRRTALIE